MVLVLGINGVAGRLMLPGFANELRLLRHKRNGLSREELRKLNGDPRFRKKAKGAEEQEEGVGVE